MPAPAKPLSICKTPTQRFANSVALSLSLNPTRNRSCPRITDADTDAGIAYSENHGSRFRLTQRIIWEGPWKFVFNGFDYDELYNLDSDPDETNNLINDPDHQARADAMMSKIWQRIQELETEHLKSLTISRYALDRVGPLNG